ncbi:MAG: MFS transporter [Enhygromyxa sp.]
MSAPRPDATLWTPAFLLAWAANFLHSTGFHAYVHLPGWLEGRGAGEVLIGVLIATMSIAAISTRPFVGRLMDTRGRRVVMIGGGLVHTVAPLLYLAVDALPNSWAAIAGVRLVHGVAQAAMFSVLFTMAADLVPAGRRAEGIALFGISGLIPMAIGGLLGDLVIVDGDYRNLFWITSACATLGLLCSLPLAETRRAGGAARSFFAAARAPELRPLWFIGTVFAMGLAAYFVFLKTYLLESPQIGSMSLFFGVYAIAAVILRALFGWVPERYGLIRVLIPSLLTGAAGLGVLAAASAPAHLMLSAVLCGIGHGFAFPIVSALVVTRARPEERGSAIAFFTALFDLGLLLGGPSFGLTVKLVGYPWTFALAGGLVGVATVVFVLWDRGVVAAESDP